MRGERGGGQAAPPLRTWVLCAVSALCALACKPLVSSSHAVCALPFCTTQPFPSIDSIVPQNVEYIENSLGLQHIPVDAAETVLVDSGNTDPIKRAMQRRMSTIAAIDDLELELAHRRKEHIRASSHVYAAAKEDYKLQLASFTVDEKKMSQLMTMSRTLLGVAGLGMGRSLLYGFPCCMFVCLFVC